MYKVGDEVLVKGEVVEVMSAVPYPVKVKLGKDEDAYLFSNDEICFADKIVKTYADGLKDAWELAREIFSIDAQDTLFHVFGEKYLSDVIRDFTVEEALAKIEAYEKEKEIKVGSIAVVKGETSKGIVTGVFSNGVVFLLWGDGSCNEFKLSELEITGETVEGLDSLLQQIGE